MMSEMITMMRARWRIYLPPARLVSSDKASLASPPAEADGRPPGSRHTDRGTLGAVRRTVGLDGNALEVSFTNEFIMGMALLLMSVSGCTCFRIL